jgi:predicted HicB family RNase H-like nuclease
VTDTKGGASGAPRARLKRGYSRDFTPRTDRRLRFEIDRVPASLHEAIRAKAKRDGVSVRALVLEYLTAWVKADGGQR